ncbi:MAG: putative Hydroxyacid oxidase [Gammaproteobacteria bacterium]|jgi:isopentenyl diphosphate isomerase/L-lactate dehydrogenase-like FMN-dependent dehydrogenase|nr:putative Hydroxyacid oxidase [Gammaproteobacteria bacterium]
MLEEFRHLHDFYEKAKMILSPDIFNFVDGGSYDELAIKRNRQSFDNTLIAPRILRGLNQRSSNIELFNHNLAAPVLIAPTAYHGLLSKNGELDMLEAANRFNTIMIVSMFSSVDYAKISENRKNPVWLQMYFLKDREINSNFVELAEVLNFEAIVLTVDTPQYAKRSRELTNPLSFLPGTAFPHLKKIGIPIEECLATKKHFSTLLDHTISWKDVEWLAGKTKLPIILKGIINPKDTEIAISFPNVNGIIISNHGGRQLDSSFTPLEVMQKHKEINGNKVKLFLDGGIRRGSDIFKALALGADATLIGRAAAWALSVGGSAGVYHALTILQNEFLETMTLCGCASPSEITSEFVTF